jgi:LmbE family N-acetylglucosaminyl deacetylase
MESDILAGIARPCCVMTVFPHPDDESFAAGGTLALFARASGVRRVSLCLTKGGKSGALLKVGLPESRETVIREQEYRTSTAILEVDQPLIWDYEDQGLPLLPEGELRRRIAATMREVKADVVITYGPDGITGHVDHQACAQAALEAARDAGVRRLYAVSAPLWIGRAVLRRKLLPPTHAVDIRSVYGVKILALKAHASQMLVSREPMIWVGAIMRIFGKEFFHRMI